MDVKSLDRNPPVPLYVQMEDFIRHEIATGSRRPGEQTPSKTTLSAALGVSQMIVRGVLNGPTSDGFLQCVPGKDTSVTRQKAAMPLPACKGVREQSEQMGLVTTTELVNIRRTILGKTIRDGLGVASSILVYEVACRHPVDSHPVSLHRPSVPVYLAPELECDDVPDG